MKRLLLGLAALFGVGCTSTGYQGPVSDHFDGHRFHNAEPIEHGFGDLLRWMRTRENHPWQRVSGFAPPPPPPARVNDGLRITWINHATVLIQVAGVNILTDPVFSERVSPLPGFGPRRYHPPGVAFDNLPPVDVVLISHAHYDHLDRASIKRLASRFDPLFVTGLGLADWFAGTGARHVVTADWWQQVALPGQLSLTVTPARHWTRRGLGDRNRTLWASYWIDTPAGGVYFAGDTGAGPHFGAIRARLGSPRVALLPIGAYEPRWFMAQQHMNPADAVQAHRQLGAAHSVGIHFATFKLSDEARFAPVDDLAQALSQAGLTRHDFWAPAFGAGYSFD
ncbi:MBL fold metallo-hydrolase [Salinisphaera aquimarina]|uniref:MBL fold metallo-hydrolase n=1 Tax=Salinisphaera aquimarina TaxID=2094031 RepID=A0ABV7ESQ7_9GAMM